MRNPEFSTISRPTLVFTENFLPAQGGSITWLVQAYSRHNPAEVLFVAGQRSGDQQIDQTLPFQVKRIPMTMADLDPTRPASLWLYTRMLWRLQKICCYHRVRQVHCAKVLPEGLVAWGGKHLTSVPYVLYAHGEEILTGVTSRKLRWLIPRIYNGATAIIANTSHTKSLLEGIGVQLRKVHVIHPGVDARAFQVSNEAASTIRQRHNLGDSPTLLTVGRLQRRKGQDAVIKGLPRIVQKIPTVKYVIVGTGEEYSALEELVQEVGVTNHVIFAGQVSDEERAAYYAACDVFIMPNRQIAGDIEGFGIVFLEAGAAGKPVIGGKSGGTGEAIEEGVTGFRVDGTNVEEIVAAVLVLLSNPSKAHTMGENGRRRAEGEFSWEAVVKHTCEVTALVDQESKGIDHGE